jgi:tRNA-binding protein
MTADPSALPLKPPIEFGQFARVDMRVARVLDAPMAEGTRKPCRLFDLDLGHLGRFRAVGQFALVPIEQLVGHKLIVCCNLGPRRMGPYTSEALVMGVPHPASPADQEQAMPLFVDDAAQCGAAVF